MGVDEPTDSDGQGRRETGLKEASFLKFICTEIWKEGVCSQLPTIAVIYLGGDCATGNKPLQTTSHPYDRQ